MVTPSLQQSSLRTYSLHIVANPLPLPSGAWSHLIKLQDTGAWTVNI